MKCCTRCGVIKSKHDYYHSDKAKKYPTSRCKACHNKCSQESKRRRGVHRSLFDAKDSSPYLGAIAERTLSKYFDNIKRMPYNNPGYDFLCGKGFKIDVKGACLRYPKGKSALWAFNSRRNGVADYFLCLAFDNRRDLNPIHIWLIPGERLNKLIGFRIVDTEGGLKKWKFYEKSLDKAIYCCNKLKGVA